MKKGNGFAVNWMVCACKDPTLAQLPGAALTIYHLCVVGAGGPHHY